MFIDVLSNISESAARKCELEAPATSCSSNTADLRPLDHILKCGEDGISLALLITNSGPI
jgi:hypothetical protein